MLRLKDSTGVNWREELPDDPENTGGGSEVTSPVDSSILWLAGSLVKFSQSSIAIVLYHRSLGLEGKFTFTFR